MLMKLINKKASNDPQEDFNEDNLKIPVGTSLRAIQLLSGVFYADQITKRVKEEVFKAQGQKSAKGHRFSQFALAILGAKRQCQNCSRYYPTKQAFHNHSVKCKDHNNDFWEAPYQFPVDDRGKLFCFLGHDEDCKKLYYPRQRQALMEHLKWRHEEEQYSQWGLTKRELLGQSIRLNCIHKPVKRRKVSYGPVPKQPQEPNITAQTLRRIEKENVQPVEISKVLIENWPQPEINEEILRPLGRKKKGVKLRDAEVQAQIVDEEQELIDICLRKRDAKFGQKNGQVNDTQPEANPAQIKEGPNITIVVPQKPLITMKQIAMLYAIESPSSFKLEYLKIKDGEVYGRRLLSPYVLFFYKIEDQLNDARARDLLETYWQTQSAINNSVTNPLAPFETGIWQLYGFLIFFVRLHDGSRAIRFIRDRTELIYQVYALLKPMHLLGTENNRITLDNIYYSEVAKKITLVEWGKSTIQTPLASLATERLQKPVWKHPYQRIGVNDTIELLWTLADADFMIEILSGYFKECPMDELPSLRARTSTVFMEQWSTACTMKGEVGCIKLERPGDARSLTYHLSKLLEYLFKKTDFANWDLYLRGAQAILERSPSIIYPYKGCRFDGIELTRFLEIKDCYQRMWDRFRNGDNMKRD